MFPAGIYYGYVYAEQTNALIKAVANHEILLPHYRGRVFQSGPVNAADYWLRKQTGQLAEDGLTVQAAGEGDSAEVQTIQFTDSAKIRHSVTIEVGKTDPQLASCNKPKYKPAPRYQLLNYEVA